VSPPPRTTTGPRGPEMVSSRPIASAVVPD